MPNTRHNKYVSVTDWFATPPTSSQTGSVQQSVSRPSPLTGGGGGGNWGSTAVPPSSGGYSLEEIQYIVETYGSGFFLRKDRDDTANGVITFNDLVKSNDFAQGNLMGAGWSIYRDGNNSVVIETDRVIVRKDMTVSELIVNQETFLKGSTIYVKAGCTLTGVEDMGTYYRCYYDNKDGDEFSGFVENDLARCLRYDKSYALIVKYYWRKVVGVGDNYVDLSKIDGEYDGVGIPEEGDDIAQLGNTEDKTRQSAVVISPDSGGSVIIWAGINSFSLSEKNMVGMGVDPSSGKAYIYGYGDLYFGDRNQEQFINYSPEDGLHINGTLSIGTKFGDKTLLDVIDSATPDGYEEFVGNVTDELNDIKVNIDGVETSIIDLQKLLDGAIETWFYEGIPTLENAPAFNWTTDELKNAHLGDLYYNKTTGKAYRFQMDDTVYLWVEITDTDIQAAMQAANAAQDTADNKRRVFITTPYPPYDKGDLWSRGSDYPLMICVVPKESGVYADGDFDYADNNAKLKEEMQDLVSTTKDELNNAIGQATEAANKYADEGIEGAKSSLQSSINALNEAKANANDVYTKAEADGIINQAEEDAILAAKQQADAAIALSEEIIKAYADGIVDEEEEARIKQAEENLKAAKDYADEKAQEAFNAIAGYEYLKEALGDGSTTVNGGLILTNLIQLQDIDGAIMAGINGTTPKGDKSIANWWGGDMFDIEDYYTWNGREWTPKSGVTIPANLPSGLIRMDGTGYLAKGKFWWDDDGKIYADPTALFLSFNVDDPDVSLSATILDIRDKQAEFADMWEVKTDANGNEYLFAKRNIVTQGGITQYADTTGLNVEGIYDALPIDGSTIYWDNGVLKAKVAEGGITSITKDMVVEALGFTPYDATNPNGYITSAALNGYATQTWVNQQGFLTEHQDLSGYQPLITSTNKLAYSLISGTPDLSVYLTTSSASSTYQPKITSSAKLAASLVSGLATVATSGSYNDLSNKPTIPTNTNQLTNGAGFITSSALSSYLPLSGGGLTGNLALKSASASDDTPKLYFQRGTTADTYYDDYIYNTGGGLTFGYSSGGIDYDLVKVTSTTLRPNSNNTYDLGSSGYKWANVYTTLINGGTPWHSGNFTPSNYLLASGYTAADVLAKLKTVDGSGSGLDADLLDGIHAEYFMRKMGYVTNANSSLISGSYRFQETLTGLPSGATAYGTMLTVSGGDTYDTLWQMYGNYNNDNLYYRRGNWSGLSSNAWKQIAFTDSNVASATKLQTARTIWGQSFDGTGNIDGKMKITYANASTQYYADNATVIIRTAVNGGVMLGLSSNTSGFSVIESSKEGVGVMPLCLNVGGGNVGIGTASPAMKLDVRGYTLIDGTTFIAAGAIGFNRNTAIGGRYNTSYNGWQWHVDTSNSKFCCYTEGTNSGMKFTLDTSGNGLFYGGITQYSDIRKKTKLQDVELTLKQVANAPLIEHYYNSDDKKTTHVGSIAQYWAGLNDWFCKLDSDGFYTMEIQNAALASAISVARELERYESKTDKKIRMLKKRINELEDEIEKLKNA